MLASIQGKSEDTYGNSKWGLLIRTNSLKLDNLTQMCSANVEDFQNSEMSNFQNLNFFYFFTHEDDLGEYIV